MPGLFKKIGNGIRNLAATKVGKTITGTIGGILGLGGGEIGGLEIEFSILIAATAFVACFVGVDKSIKFFTTINEARQKDK